MTPDDQSDQIQDQHPTGPAQRPSGSMWSAVDTVSIDAGHVIGPYIIQELLGQGGYGVVYRAEQTEPVQRQVAIKIIKPGMGSKAVIARFEQERQTLAVLDHPNVARVLDAGTFLRGVPYFVMDYVDGEPITTYCDRNTLCIRDRLQLFIDVCDAVQHAHMKGIIHRDLKPSNILVASGDGRKPMVKVIDFGVAKALSGAMASGEVNTEHGQLIGTREYMSPEQAAMGATDIDTRTDVYALGVVLYELLAGALPFDSQTLRTAGQAQIERLLRERAPAKPSTRFSTVDGQAGVTIARNRQTPRDALLRELSRELDWIPLKAIRTERAERYRSASDLADDIHNYLRGDPLEAGPTAVTYRLGKFIRRHRGPVVAAAMVLIALVAGLIGVSVALQQATQQREIAQQREQESLAAQQAESRQRQRAQAEAERAQQAEEEAGQLADELQLVVDFQAIQFSTIDTAAMGQRMRDGVVTMLRTALETQGGDEEAVADAIHDFERSLTNINFTDIALDSVEHDIFGRALATIDARFADQPLVRARLLHSVASTFRSLGLPEQATTALKESLDIRRKELGDANADTLLSINEMGSLLRDLSRYDEAEAHYREALEGRRHLLGSEHPSTLQSINNLGLLFKDQGRYAAAEVYLREALDGYRVALGEEHVYTATAALNVGGVLQNRRHFTAARPLFEEALDGFQRTVGEDHRHTLQATFRLAWLLQKLGEHDEAERLYHEALTGQRRVLGSAHPATLMTVNNIGWLHFERGAYAEAEPHLREALETRRATLGDYHTHTLRSTANMGVLRHALGDQAAAELHLREAMIISRQIYGDEHMSTLRATSNLSAVLRIAGNLQEAAQLAAEVVSIARDTTPHQDTFLTRSMNHYATILVELGHFRQAESQFLDVYTMAVEHHGIDHEHTESAIRNLVDHYNAWHETEPDAGHDLAVKRWRAKLISDIHD